MSTKELETLQQEDKKNTVPGLSYIELDPEPKRRNEAVYKSESSEFSADDVKISDE